MEEKISTKVKNKQKDLLNVKKTRYRFGVMSSEYELYSSDFTIAYIAISLYIQQYISVAVFEPQYYGFMPKDILEINIEYAKDKEDLLREVMMTINKLK